VIEFKGEIEVDASSPEAALELAGRWRHACGSAVLEQYDQLCVRRMHISPMPEVQEVSGEQDVTSAGRRVRLRRGKWVEVEPTAE